MKKYLGTIILIINLIYYYFYKYILYNLWDFDGIDFPTKFYEKSELYQKIFWFIFENCWIVMFIILGLSIIILFFWKYQNRLSKILLVISIILTIVQIGDFITSM